MKIEDFLYKYRIPLVSILVGLILVFVSSFFIISSTESNNELVVTETIIEESSELVVEISGAVKNPGVYKMQTGARVEDLILKSGGFDNEDTDFVSKTINRAAVLKDGQKLYIPSVDDQSSVLSASNSEGYIDGSSGTVNSGGSLININNASKTQLESLPGIGPVYAQNIIDHRPYSDLVELVDKDVLKQGVFDKIHEYISVY